GDADGVDAAVLPEVLVLGGDDGVDQDLRDLVVGDDDPVLLAVERGGGGGGAAVAVDLVGADEGRLGEGVGLLREVDAGEDQAHPGQGRDDDQQAEEEQAAPAPEHAPAAEAAGGAGGPG